MSSAMANSSSKIKRQTAGLTILQWLTYAFWYWLILGLIWVLALILASAMIDNASRAIAEMVPFAFATVAVLLPAAFVIDLFYRRHESPEKTGASAVVMTVHAVLFAVCSVGALVATIFVVLGGLVDGIFSDERVVAVLTLLGATVLFAMTLPRVLYPAKIVKLPLIYSSSMLGISLVILTFGFIGPVSASIKTRNDRHIESGLYDVSQQIQNYINTNKEAPASLDDLRPSGHSAKLLIDNNLVGYKDEGVVVNQLGTLEKHRYQLCVTYAEAGVDSYTGTEIYYSLDEDGYRSYPVTNSHSAGEVCYKLQAVISLVSDGLEASPYKLPEE